MRLHVLILVLAACGGSDVDLTGVYRVDSAVGSMPCGADASITYPAFLRFEKMEFLGQPFFAYDGCTDETATECTSVGGLIGGFFEPTDDGWLGRTSFSSGGGASCTLGIINQSATLRSAALTIEISSHEEEVDGLPDDQCDPDEAERRGTEMPCIEHSLIDATKL